MRVKHLGPLSCCFACHVLNFGLQMFSENGFEPLWAKSFKHDPKFLSWISVSNMKAENELSKKKMNAYKDYLNNYNEMFNRVLIALTI